MQLQYAGLFLTSFGIGISTRLCDCLFGGQRNRGKVTKVYSVSFPDLGTVTVPTERHLTYARLLRYQA
jgi:hypothetical protein